MHLSENLKIVYSTTIYYDIDKTANDATTKSLNE